MSAIDRPRFRVSADRQAASRRVRYVETNAPLDGNCSLCRLDEEPPLPPESRSMSAETDDSEESFAEATLIQAIENQIESGEPPAARATLNKLTLVGYEREEILELMALVLAAEIRAMLAEDRPFDLARYETALRALPQLPDDPDQG